MSNQPLSIYSELADSIVSLDKVKTDRIVKRILEENLDSNLAIFNGLVKGMESAGRKYENKQFHVPELLIAAGLFKDGVNTLISKQKDIRNIDSFQDVKVIIGVMEGDFHEIGKNLVKIMLDTAGFQVFDLGRNVTIHKFVDSAISEKAAIVCMSSMISTSMLGMQEVINLLIDEGVRSRVKVLVGGACVTPAYAREIGADGYAPDAVAAVREAKRLVK